MSRTPILGLRLLQPPTQPSTMFGTSPGRILANAEQVATQKLQQIHEALDPVARKMRTTAVVSTNGQEIAAGGARDLTKAQREVAESLGMDTAKSPKKHAELTGLDAARGAGLRPKSITSTRDFCDNCRGEIIRQGGEIQSPRHATFPE
jgi:hypothetical protein